jgi:hypothetical protein
MLEHIVTAAALLAAVLALARARRMSRRIDKLTESYWELRYEYGQLRARMARLEGRSDPELEARSAPPPQTAFIPLTSLKR